MKLSSIRRRARTAWRRPAEHSVGPRSRLDRDVAALFDQLFAPAHPFRPVGRNDVTWHPFTDVFESETHFVIRMELAGVDPASIRVLKEGRNLIIRGRRPDPMRGRPLACHQLEISHGPFERVICLPLDFPKDGVSTEYGSAAGFLQVTVEKELR